jgi:hypothetical protein
MKLTLHTYMMIIMTTILLLLLLIIIMYLRGLKTPVSMLVRKVFNVEALDGYFIMTVITCNNSNHRALGWRSG